MNLIVTPSTERWLNTTKIDRETATGILRFAADQLDQAQETHPVIALQSVIAAFTAFAENLDMTEKQAMEFFMEHYRLIRPVLRDNPMGHVEGEDGNSQIRLLN